MPETQPDAAQPARLYAEQVKLLYTNLPGSLMATVANALILIFLLRNVISHEALLVWLGVIVLITACRYVLVHAYRRAPMTPADAPRWGFWFTAGVFLAGCTWGAVAIFLFPEDLPHRLFVIFILAGTTAGGVVNLSALMRTASIFILTVLIPLILHLLLASSEILLAMGAMSVVFMALMLATARRMYVTTLTSLNLSFKNSDLINYLEKEKESTEKLNRELKQEIKERARIAENLRRSEGRIHAVVDNVLDGIITMNDNGFIATMNPAAVRIFGYSEEEVIGRHLKILISESERDEYDSYFNNYKTTKNGKMTGFGLEINGRRRDGSIFPMEVGISDMWFDDWHMHIGIIRDITERKKIDRMKTQFIAAVSHELRTPLASVVNSLELFADGAAGELSERGTSLLTIARNNMERLVYQINDILDIDDIQSGKMKLDLRPVDLAVLARQIIDSTRVHNRETGKQLVLEEMLPGAWVQADQSRLTHVINHLLANALKFSPPRGTIEVKLTRHEGLIRISVTDHGPGIPDSFRDQIFKPFTQADVFNDGGRGGAGLGLSIAKAIIEKHGGHIGFNTGSGKGTCFYFDLPEWRSECGRRSSGQLAR